MSDIANTTELVHPRAKLYEALAKAHGEIEAPLKNRTVDFTHNGQRTYYKYADLADVIDCYRQPLHKNGLSVSHSMGYNTAGKFIMTTFLQHSSGQSISTDYPLPDPVNMKAQGFGSALTYARRYSVSALLGIASEEDDDGHGANGDQPIGDGKKNAPKGNQVAQTKPPVVPPPIPKIVSNAEKKSIMLLLKEHKIPTKTFQSWLKVKFNAIEVSPANLGDILARLSLKDLIEDDLLAEIAQLSEAQATQRAAAAPQTSPSEPVTTTSTTSGVRNYAPPS